MDLASGAYNMSMGLLNMPAWIIGVYADLFGMMLSGEGMAI
jgi:hypothetical protein